MHRQGVLPLSAVATAVMLTFSAANISNRALRFSTSCADTLNCVDVSVISDVTLVQKLAPCLLMCPISHGAQEVAPLCAAYVFWRHGLHDAAAIWFV